MCMNWMRWAVALMGVGYFPFGTVIDLIAASLTWRCWCIVVSERGKVARLQGRYRWLDLSLSFGSCWHSLRWPLDRRLGSMG